MNAINAICNVVANLTFGALSVFPPLAALIVLSAILGVLMTFVFKYTSNQKALKRVVDRSRANLLAMKLFKDELGVAIRCMGSLFKMSGLRLWFSLVPMLVLIVPFVLILAQVGLRYQFRPLPVGRSAVVKLRLSEKAFEQYKNVVLTAPEGVAVETQPVRNRHDFTWSWRVRPEAPGAHVLHWKLGDESTEKLLVVGNDSSELAAVSTLRPGPNFWDRLLYPAEPAFAAGAPVQQIRLYYSSTGSTPIFGYDLHWLATFFIVSIVIALVAKPFVKVQF